MAVDPVMIGAMARYAGVVTTGIYCRPGCGGRPRADHVVPFSTAAAAEAAGYRACRRCRPYREGAPVPAAGLEVVDEAVRMILAGVLDGGTEADLAARLRISPRHLRRLFTAHLGMTADQLARSSRAHFARQLLDDTELPLVDIAVAAGFGSVRQFNRSLLARFRATPAELRARRRSGDRLGTEAALIVRLPFSPPLEWDGMLGYLARRAIPGVEQVAAGAYRRTVEVDGEPGTIELWRGGESHLLLRVRLPRWEGLLAVVRRARRLFNLDIDLVAAHAVLGRDPRLAPLLGLRPGLRAVGAWDPFETGVRVILGQQVGVSAAGTLTGRLVARHGASAGELGGPGLGRLFPGPGVLAEAHLDGLGLTGSRARAVQSFAAAVARGRLCLGAGHTLEELTGEIVRVPGLGPWTAHCLALRLGHRDAFPASDLGLRRALAGGGRPLGSVEVGRLAEPWRPWRAHAASHLWLAG